MPQFDGDAFLLQLVFALWGIGGCSTCLIGPYVVRLSLDIDPFRAQIPGGWTWPARWHAHR